MWHVKFIVANVIFFFADWLFGFKNIGNCSTLTSWCLHPSCKVPRRYLSHWLSYQNVYTFISMGNDRRIDDLGHLSKQNNYLLHFFLFLFFLLLFTSEFSLNYLFILKYVCHYCKYIKINVSCLFKATEHRLVSKVHHILTTQITYVSGWSKHLTTSALVWTSVSMITEA